MLHLYKCSSLQYWVLAVLWALFILVLSAMPGQQLPSMEWLWQPDKLAHATVYAILGFLLWKAISQHFLQKTSLILTFFIATGYGVAMETMQYAFFPGRYFELWDIVANIIGAIAIILFIAMKKRKTEI